jgi:hypothetical protein
MPYKPSRPRIGLAIVVAFAFAFALVPGSMSATRAAGSDPFSVAVEYLGKHAEDHGVTAADVAGVAVTSQYRTAHLGVTHVNLNQRVQGLEVFTGHVTVNVADDGRVVFAAGSLADTAIASAAAKIEATDAVEAAAEALDLGETSDVRVISEEGGAAQATVVSRAGVSDGPIAARLGWQPTAAGLRKAWQVVIDSSSSDAVWNATIDAESGQLLASDDWTDYDKVDDLAARLGRPGNRRLLAPFAAAAATIVPPSTVNDGSSYRAYQVPNESPNDGPRTLVQNPADAMASPFGWHDTDGIPGPEFTSTQGAAAHAYLDQDDSETPDVGYLTDGGPGLDFDFPADLTEHATNYRDAVVANLFYMNSAFHDLLWRRGMDEPAGNFQANNYGRGGLGGDYVRAEAADGSGTNNANFSTPSEPTTTGAVPRMQMYLWPGNQFGSQNQVVVTGVGEFNANWARFSPAPTVAGTAGTFFDAGNGCVAADYAGAPAGNSIAIVTGNNTGCQNVVKGRVASAAGVEALVVAHTTTAAAPILAGAMTEAPPTIPVASITQADGNAIRAAITAGPTTGNVRKHPSHPGIRDGDFENGIIIHEYGHGVSNRLTGGPAVNCLSGNEQMGEGWSDYLAISTLLDPALDDPDLPRGMGPYALFQADRHGAGIRPRPYTRDMSIQPFTYDSIKTGGWLNGTSLALPHGLGHGWASVLWDMTWDLIDKHGFTPQIYGAWDSAGNTRAQQYVMDGMKMQGCGPGLVVGSRAIIAAADLLSDGEDTCTVWAAFARRGLGYSAVQGTTDRNDNTEAFDTHPDCAEGFFGRIQEGTLNTLIAGNTRDMVFNVPKALGSGSEILADGTPYSRRVDCNTLAVSDPDSQFITPRPIPVLAESPAGEGLSNYKERHTFPWQTLAEWNGTCREFVITRTDGIQHRAFFRFSKDPSYPVSGRVRDASGAPIAGARVSLDGTESPVTATTDANGFYSFDSIIKGVYAATAAATACETTDTKEVEIKRKTSIDFTLGKFADPFGYGCDNVASAFQEAANALTVPDDGDDEFVSVALPFTFRFYGVDYATAFVSTNGNVNFLAGNTSTGNAAIPSTGNPNAAIFAYWDDLHVDAPAASLRTDTLGTAPNRRFVVEWRNVSIFGDPTRRLDVSLTLFENGQILTQTRNLADDGRERGNSASLGIENATGTVGLRYSFNQAVLAAEPAVSSILYQPPAG